MRLIVAALILISNNALAGDGQCKDSYLPHVSSQDSIQTIRAKLLTSGFFPVYSAQPKNAPENRLRKIGLFEFSDCLNTNAFKGCYANWLTRSGEKISIAFPDDRPPFIADCPKSMREN